MSSADGLKLVMPPEGGFMVELDGEPQAFGVILPNLHEITADLAADCCLSAAARHLGLGTIPLCPGGSRSLVFAAPCTARRGRRVILAFIEEMRQRSKSSSFEHVEFGWVLEDISHAPADRALRCEIDKVTESMRKSRA